MQRPYGFDNAIIQLLYGSGLFRLFEAGYAGRGSILTFHRVGPPPPDADFMPNKNLEVSQEFFERIVRLLLDRGIEIVPLDEARRRIAAPQPGRRFTCLTLDDGYKDNYEYAFPVCRRLNVPMTVYVTSGFVDRTATPWWLVLEELVRANARVEFSWEGAQRVFPAESMEEKLDTLGKLSDLLRGMDAQGREALIGRLCEASGTDHRAGAQDAILTWDMVREMARSGLVEIGGHTVSHPQLASQDQATAFAEIRDGCAAIEGKIGQPVRHMAYPFGLPRDAGPREFAMCRELGLKTAVTTRHANVMAAHRDQLHALPRLPMSGLRQSRAAAEVMLSGSIAAVANGFRRTVTA